MEQLAPLFFSIPEFSDLFFFLVFSFFSFFGRVGWGVVVVILTGTVTRPRAGTACWLGNTSCRQSGGRVAAAAKVEVLGQGANEAVAHRAEGVEVGDVVLVQGAAGENGLVAGEDDVCFRN